MIRHLRSGITVLVLVLTATACSGGAEPGGSEAGDRPVKVLGPWTGKQEDAFRALLDKSKVDYIYQGTAAQREVLLSQVQAGTPPDIAVMPNVGELADYARDGQLRSLEGLYEPTRYGPPWVPRASGTGHSYWVPVKADLKSIVWHRSDDGPPAERPPRIDEWCVGMGDDGASGWPGSDWIEDILLQRYGPRLYARWAGGAEKWTSERVESVWRGWGTLLKQSSGKAKRALLTDHRGEAGKDGLLYSGGRRTSSPCTLEHQGSFARTFYDDKAAGARFTLSHTLLPGGPYPERGREVSADYAAMFTRTDQSQKLLRYLASADVQQRWAKQNKPPVYPFSANSGVSDRTHDDRTSQRIATLLTDEKAARCLDASDTMPPAVRDAFYEATLRFMSNPDDPRPLLKGIQKVQQVEQDKLRAQGELRKDGTWMTGVCS